MASCSRREATLSSGCVWDSRRVQRGGRPSGRQCCRPRDGPAPACVRSMTGRKSIACCHGGELRGGGGNTPETRQCLPFVFTAVITCSGFPPTTWAKQVGGAGGGFCRGWKNQLLVYKRFFARERSPFGKAAFRAGSFYSSVSLTK